LDEFTACRDVIFLATLKAEDSSALTFDGFLEAVIRPLYYIFTVLLWAPFDIRIVIGELFAVPKVVLFSVVHSIIVGLIF